jgi:hypothetical protein
MPKLAYVAIVLIFFEAAVALIGYTIGPGLLRPTRLKPEGAAETQAMLDRTRAAKTDFDVPAPDGVELRGWKVHPPSPNGD